jgi:hypothetical protein
MFLYILFYQDTHRKSFSLLQNSRRHVIPQNSPEFEISLIEAYHRPLIIFSATQHQHMLNPPYLSSSCLEEGTEV